MENTQIAPVTQRPARPEDRHFLSQVYAFSRADEMAIVPWTMEEKATFLRQQFEAQDTFYHQHYPEAAFLVLERDGEAIGRLYIDRSFPDEIRLMDIALLPAFRGQGIGTTLIREVIVEAAAAGKAVRLHVESFNPARRLYDRLGFRFLEERGPYLFMEWCPAKV